MTHNIYIYIAIMAGVSFLIRTLPLTLIRKPITNRFLRSFLFYVPYVTLAVMTFPAIVQATQSPIAGALALVLGMALAFNGASLFTVAASCCAVVRSGFCCNRLIWKRPSFLRERTAFNIEPPVSSCYNGCIQLGGARNRPLQQTKGRLFYAQRCFPDYQP